MSELFGGSGGGGDVAAHEAAADPHIGYRLESDTIVVRPNETKTNSTTDDQDFTSIFQIPANYLTAQKVLRVTLDFSHTTDGSASTMNFYLKLGSTKVFTYGAAITPANNQTRNYNVALLIFGTAAAGAAAAVDVSLSRGDVGSPGSQINATATQNLATDGALDIVPGIDFGTATGGENLILRNAIIEKVN